MRNRLTSAVVLVFLSVPMVGAQAPQQPQAPQQTADAQKEEMRLRSIRMFERLRLRLSDPADTQKQAELAQAMAEAAEASRVRQREANTCAVPDGTRAELNAEVFFDGRLYRCVEVFETNDAPGMANAPLKRRTAGLVRVQVQ